MGPVTPELRIDRAGLADWYRRNRARSEAIFDLIDPSAYYSRPISLRNPIVFYEGHLPAFSVIAFLRRGLGLPPVDARLETLFERGIDPETEASAVPRSGASTAWPSREEVRAFARACDDAVIGAMSSLPFDSRSLAQGRPPGPLALEGLYTALEHEAMHQETLLYMWHRLPYDQKHRPGVRSAFTPTAVPGPHEIANTDLTPPRRPNADLTPVRIAPGAATLGAARERVAFGWDNEFDAHQVHVPAFDVDALPITNAQCLEFIAAGGYHNREVWDDEGWEWIQKERIQHPAFWTRDQKDELQEHRRPGEIPEENSPELLASCYSWRGMFQAFPLPLTWPVYTSHAEASAYARWKGRRLMTEAEWHRAAEGSTTGHFDFAGFDPIPVGSHPPSAAGVYDFVGNGWEWTSTVFAPFDGFVPMASYPEYSADFFDGRHYVMKGASPATARELVRPSFRNWFRGNYPYVYAKFRTAGR